MAPNTRMMATAMAITVDMSSAPSVRGTRMSHKPAVAMLKQYAGDDVGHMTHRAGEAAVHYSRCLACHTRKFCHHLFLSSLLFYGVLDLALCVWLGRFDSDVYNACFWNMHLQFALAHPKRFQLYFP